MENTEKKLIEQLQSDNPKGLQAIYHRYYKVLIAFAFGYLKNSESARDAVQSVFIALWEKRYSLDPNLSLKSYLYQSVKNRCINEIKYQLAAKRQVAQHIEYTNQEEDPLTTLIYAETLAKLTSIINELPEKCQEIFKMSRFEGCTYLEISQKLFLSVKTVETQMGIALKKIKEKFSG